MECRLDNLAFSWKEPLFRSLNAVLTGGDLIWLRGENGSGKSTLLMLLAGMIPHFQRGTAYGGDIILQGRSLKTNPPKTFFPLIGYVDSRHAGLYLLNESLEEELLLAASILNQSRQEIDLFLDETGEIFPDMRGFTRCRFSSFTPSERCLALLLLYAFQGAELILLDEVFKTADPECMMVWEGFIRWLVRERKAALVYTCHGLELEGGAVWRLQGGDLVI